MRELLMLLTGCFSVQMQVPYEVEVMFTNVGGNYSAATRVVPGYLTAYIAYDLNKIQDSTEARVTVIHEMAHVLTWDLGLVADEADAERSMELFEQLATRIEKWEAWDNVCKL